MWSSVSSKDLLIKNAEILDSEKVLKADVLIRDGVIVEIGKGLSANFKVVDAQGFILMPGAIDVHFHIREFDESDEEDIISGTKSAVHGGITTIFIMPNTYPPLDNEKIISYVKTKCEESALCEVYVVGCATEGRKGEKLAPYGKMKRAGIIAISDDGEPIKNSLVLRNVLEYAKTFDLILIEHAEDKDLRGILTESDITVKYGIKPYPSVSEGICVARDILMAEYLSAKIHFTHISSELSVEIIRWAKMRGVNVSADTTPHHLLLSIEDISDPFDPNIKVNPPLKSKKDNMALIRGLKEGVILAISSDHAPWSKKTDISTSPFGISSADFFIPILWKLVREGIFSPQELSKFISLNPAKIFGIKNVGLIKEGYKANLVIFDPDSEEEPKKFFSKGKNFPWKNIKGKILKTIVKGNLVYENE